MGVVALREEESKLQEQNPADGKIPVEAGNGPSSGSVGANLPDDRKVPFGVVDFNGVVHQSHSKFISVRVPGERSHHTVGPEREAQRWGPPKTALAKIGSRQTQIKETIVARRWLATSGVGMTPLQRWNLPGEHLRKLRNHVLAAELRNEQNLSVKRRPGLAADDKRT